MAQNYTEITDVTTLQNSRNQLLDNSKTAITNSSGTAFPTGAQLIGNGQTFWDTSTDSSAGSRVMWIRHDGAWEQLCSGFLYDDDADDGSRVSVSQLLRSDANDTASGEYTFSATGGVATFSGSSGEIRFDGSGSTALKRIGWNDGTGSWTFRAGHRHNGANEVYNVTGDGASLVQFSSDAQQGALSLRVAATGTAGATITWAHTLLMEADGTFTYDGNNILHAGNFVAGTDYQAADAQLTDVAGFSVTKGLLTVADGSNLTQLSVGTNNQALVADSATSSGIKWATTVADATEWAGAAKTVSTSAPSGGADGDIWFQREV